MDTPRARSVEITHPTKGGHLPALSLDPERLKRLRLERALTQSELAQQAQLHFTTLSRIENGVQRANISTIRRLASALGVEITAIAAIVTECVA